MENSSRHGHSFPWDEKLGRITKRERFDVLVEKMALGMTKKNYGGIQRRFGSAVHSGFGLGLKVLFVTGMTNIRDVIPSKNTIECRVFFTKSFFTQEELIVFYQKSSKALRFLKYCHEKAKALRKSCIL
jgi:hypothetical protein